jgi:protein SCO1/2
VKSQELAGQVWVADFVYTSCGGICPIMTEKMRKLQDKLPAEIRLVSFSVDPDTDTPATLTAYAKRYGADPDRWFFLTGNKASLVTLSKEGFKLALDDTGGTQAEPITHSSRFVLVDRQGRIRGYYSMDEESEMAHIVRDAKSLLKG